MTAELASPTPAAVVRTFCGEPMIFDYYNAAAGHAILRDTQEYCAHCFTRQELEARLKRLRDSGLACEVTEQALNAWPA